MSVKASIPRMSGSSSTTSTSATPPLSEDQALGLSRDHFVRIDPGIGRCPHPEFTSVVAIATTHVNSGEWGDGSGESGDPDSRPGSAAGDGGDDRDDLAGAHLGVDAVEEPDVLLVHEDVDEPAERAGLVEQPVLEARMGGVERLQCLADGRALDR